MKKLIALILLAVLLLSLGGCGKSISDSQESDILQNAQNAEFSKAEAAAFEAASKMIEEGKYDEAIQVLNAIPIYGAIESAIRRAEELRGTGSGLFSGKWYDLNSINGHGYYLEFPGNGRVICGATIDGGEVVVPCSFEGDSVYITNTTTQITYRLTIVEIDGITHLQGNLFGSSVYDLVSAEVYENLVSELPEEIEPVTITLTAENWMDYLEIRPFETSEKKDAWSNEIITHSGFAFFLKDEYTDRFVRQEDLTLYFTITANNKEIKSYANIGEGDPYNRNNALTDHVGGIITYGGLGEGIPAPIEDINSISVVNVVGKLVLDP